MTTDRTVPVPAEFSAADFVDAEKWFLRRTTCTDAAYPFERAILAALRRAAAPSPSPAVGQREPAIGWPEEAKEAWRALVTLKNAADSALVEAERKIRGYQRHLDAAQQIAGKALGYPWFKDDQKNFPGATEADGVCIGEHAGETIVEELAQKYLELKAAK